MHAQGSASAVAQATGFSVSGWYDVSSISFHFSEMKIHAIRATT
jgi:hypothetical protein